jgi:hypothetical protein
MPGIGGGVAPGQKPPGYVPPMTTPKAIIDKFPTRTSLNPSIFNF